VIPVKRTGRSDPVARAGTRESLPIPCRVAVDLLPLMAAGAAAELEVEQVRRHAADCPACRARLVHAVSLIQALEADAAELRGLPPGAISGAATRLGASLREGLAAQERRRDRRGLVLTLGPVVVVYLTALFTLIARLSRPSPWTIVAAGLYVVGVLVTAPVLLVSRRLAGTEE
jgi:hypothetical protein